MKLLESLTFIPVSWPLNNDNLLDSKVWFESGENFKSFLCKTSS